MKQIICAVSISLSLFAGLSSFARADMCPSQEELYNKLVAIEASEFEKKGAAVDSASIELFALCAERLQSSTTDYEKTAQINKFVAELKKDSQNLSSQNS